MKALAVLVTLISALVASVAGAETNVVVVRLEMTGAQTNGAPPSLPTPPPLPHIPLSVKIRQAAQEAKGKAAPWTQKLIATKVEEVMLNQTEDDEDGVPRGKTTFTTNYVVTLAPVSENEPLSVWGAVKAKTIRVVTNRPTKKGDEFTLYPEP